MREEKSTPLPMVEIGNGSGEQLSLSEEIFPRQYNTGQTDSAIMRILPKGMENAISAHALAEMLGLGDTRALRQKITQERIRGHLILSTPEGGYFLPDDGEKGRKEARMYLSMMDARTRTTAHTTEAARQFVKGGGIVGE